MVSEKKLFGNLSSLFRQLLHQLPILITLLLVAGALARIVGLGLGILPSWMVILLEQMSDFAVVFLGIVIEAAPFLLLGTFASGIVRVFIDREDLARWIPRRPLLAALSGSLIGLFFPVGECGVVPFARSLMDKGAPVPAAAAVILAGPVLNPIVIAGTLAFFGAGPIFWGRMVLTFLVAILASLLFSAFARTALLRRSPVVVALSVEQPQRNPAFKDKLRGALLIMVDEAFEIGRFLILGAALAALLQAFVRPLDLLDAAQGPVSSILAMMGMAVLMSTGSAMDAFAALQFPAAFSAAAVLAFLVLGPMVDIKNVWMFLRVFNPRAVAVLVSIPLLLTLLGTLVLSSSGMGW